MIQKTLHILENWRYQTGEDLKENNNTEHTVQSYVAGWDYSGTNAKNENNNKQ